MLKNVPNLPRALGVFGTPLYCGAADAYAARATRTAKFLITDGLQTESVAGAGTEAKIVQSGKIITS